MIATKLRVLGTIVCLVCVTSASPFPENRNKRQAPSQEPSPNTPLQNDITKPVNSDAKQQETQVPNREQQQNQGSNRWPQQGQDPNRWQQGQNSNRWQDSGRRPQQGQVPDRWGQQNTAFNTWQDQSGRDNRWPQQNGQGNWQNGRRQNGFNENRGWQNGNGRNQNFESQGERRPNSNGQWQNGGGRRRPNQSSEESREQFGKPNFNYNQRINQQRNQPDIRPIPQVPKPVVTVNPPTRNNNVQPVQTVSA